MTTVQSGKAQKELKIYNSNIRQKWNRKKIFIYMSRVAEVFFIFFYLRVKDIQQGVICKQSMEQV